MKTRWCLQSHEGDVSTRHDHCRRKVSNMLYKVQFWYSNEHIELRNHLHNNRSGYSVPRNPGFPLRSLLNILHLDAPPVNKFSQLLSTVLSEGPSFLTLSASNKSYSRWLSQGIWYWLGENRFPKRIYTLKNFGSVISFMPQIECSSAG